MQAPCDAALEQVIERLDPQAIVALGRYAQARVQSVAGDALPVRYLLHPSPANPMANRHWPAFAQEALGPWLPTPPGAVSAQRQP